MSKRTTFTTISPLPPGVSREVVLDFLHNHTAMIDLNPLVVERHPIDVPADASWDERGCAWYSLTDKIDYLPGGRVSGDVSYTCAFHDLPAGIQTHCRAPLGLDLRDKWTLHGSLPGEPPERPELGLGAPASGLYLREDVDMRCNLFMTSFVKKNLKRSHAVLVDKLVEQARLASAAARNGGRAAGAGAGAAAGAEGTTPPPFALSTPPSWSSPPPSSHSSSTASSSSTSTRCSQAPTNAAHTIHRKPTPENTTTTAATPFPPLQIHHGSPPRDSATVAPPPPPPPPAHDSAQAQVHAQLYSHCPYAIRTPPMTPHAAPQQPPAPAPAAAGWQTPPHSPPPAAAVSSPPVRPHPSDVPAPLRIRGSSVGSNHRGQYGAPLSLRTVPSSLTTATATSGGRGSGEYYHEHPDYPHLNPYSPTEHGGGALSPSSYSSSPDGRSPRSPRSPPTPPFLLVAGPGLPVVSGGGSGFAGGKKVHDDEFDCPASLRPGGKDGFSARLSGPFVAELE